MTLTQPRRYLPAMVLIVSLFFLWGVANNLNDVLIAHFRKAFALSDFQSGLVQSAFYFGYFTFAIPAALFMHRFGYKAAVVLGLLLYAAGALLFYPAAAVLDYEFFLAALFIIASGLAFLETSANPLVAVLGPPETAARRLNLAQAFNPLGAISGVLIGRSFILSGVEHTAEQTAALSPEQLAAYQATEAHAVQLPYLVLGSFVLLWALLVLFTKFPKVQEPAGDGAVGTGFAGLLKHPHYVFGVVAQFFYVGAQVGVWSYMIRYAQHAMPGMGEKIAAEHLTVSLVGFMIGRFLGTALMGRFRPSHLMALFAGVNIVLTVIAAFAVSRVGLYALVATSFFMSIMFPTIFALALKGLGPRTKAGSSLLVMAIIGGAVLTAVMGQISDMSAINLAMLVPAAAFAVVGAFALSKPAS